MADPELYDSLEGQTALVTGATRGIGAAIADRLVEYGATVYAGARDTAEVGADDRHAVELDVLDRERIEAAIDRIRTEAGDLDVLVNNAAIYGPSGPLAEIDADGIDRVLRTNLHGPIHVTREALPLLGGGARVINVSSGAGQHSTGGIDDGGLAYGTSKAGLNGFTSALAGQYPELFVAAVDPGWVRTDMGGDDAPRAIPEGADTPAWLARVRDGPSGRFWKDRDVIDW